MAAIARVACDRLAPETELAGFIERQSGAGAVASFVGLMRPLAKDGSALDALFLDHYPGMTEASLEAIANDALGRFDVSDLLVVHRCGLLKPGEAIVFVAAASLHRRAAFLAADYLMDRLKTEAAFWKREDTADGSRWIEPTEDDRADRARWRE